MEDRKDVELLRELARRYVEICSKDIQKERRDLWRMHNSLKKTRPLIYVRCFATWHEIPESRLECEDPFFQQHEKFLRQMIFQDTLGDDYVPEPWITQRAALVTPPEGPWGVRYGRIPSTEKGGAWKNDPPLKRLEDVSKLARPRHLIDEEKTSRAVSRLRDAVGDILQVNVDRSPFHGHWHGDISTYLGNLRGVEQIMWDMVDNPGWLHELLGFMRDGILGAHEAAEAAGDWHLSNHRNQAMPYAEELADPAPDGPSVGRENLWVFMASQELTLVSPQMHDEFMLRYQIPIMEKFGLAAYGCCEDLTHKTGILRKIPNLRRISVTPRADVRKSAEEIGADYVISWRPNPAEMVCCGFDPEHVRGVVKDAMEACKGLHVDITLKDVETVENEPERLRRWVECVRRVSDDY